MVAGQDINFDLIHALGKDKEGQKGKEDGEEERNQDQEQRPRSLSAGPSRYIAPLWWVLCGGSLFKSQVPQLG